MSTHRSLDYSIRAKIVNVKISSLKVYSRKTVSHLSLLTSQDERFQSTPVTSSLTSAERDDRS